MVFSIAKMSLPDGSNSSDAPSVYRRAAVLTARDSSTRKSCGASNFDEVAEAEQPPMQLFGVADGGGDQHVVGVEVGDRLVGAERRLVQVRGGAAEEARFEFDLGAHGVVELAFLDVAVEVEVGGGVTGVSVAVAARMRCSASCRRSV